MHIVKGVYPELDKEAYRLISTLPDFIPGMDNGKPISFWYSLPVNFKYDKNKMKKNKGK